MKRESDLNRKIKTDKSEDQIKKEAGFPLQVYHLKDLGFKKKFVREKTIQSFTFESEGFVQEAAHHSTEVLWLSCVNIPFMVFFVSTFS